MYINIIFEESNGLIHDASVLSSLLLRQGHIIQLNSSEVHCSLGIFLEHITPSQLYTADRFLFFPNLEWITLDDLHWINDPRISKICCKTLDTFQKLSQLSEKCVFTSMDSLPVFPCDSSKKFEFIHVKGTSMFKNSQLVFDVWRRHPEWPMLHLIYESVISIQSPIILDNITLYQHKMDKDKLDQLMHTCAFHICCSECEGFGHYINEARSCGAHIITTDAPPMNELVTTDFGTLITPHSQRTIQLLGLGYSISEKSFEDAVNNLIKANHLPNLPHSQNFYKQNKLFFEKKMLLLING